MWCKITFWLFFCERFRTSCYISPTNFNEPTILPEIVDFLKFVGEIQQLVRKRSQKNYQNVILHYIYLSIALPKTLPHSKTIKIAKKLSVFGKNDSRCLPNFLQTYIFWHFDHISRTYNQIDYSNIWIAKVIIILIMTAQVLFFDVFSEKDPHLNAVEEYHIILLIMHWF